MQVDLIETSLTYAIESIRRVALTVVVQFDPSCPTPVVDAFTFRCSNGAHRQDNGQRLEPSTSGAEHCSVFVLRAETEH